MSTGRFPLYNAMHLGAFGTAAGITGTDSLTQSGRGTFFVNFLWAKKHACLGYLVTVNGP